MLRSTSLIDDGVVEAWLIAVCHSLPIRMKREDALHIVNGEIDELLTTILCCTGSNFNLHNASTTVQEITKLLIYLLMLSACL